MSEKIDANIYNLDLAQLHSKLRVLIHDALPSITNPQGLGEISLNRLLDYSKFTSTPSGNDISAAEEKIFTHVEDFLNKNVDFVLSYDIVDGLIVFDTANLQLYRNEQIQKFMEALNTNSDIEDFKLGANFPGFARELPVYLTATLPEI